MLDYDILKSHGSDEQMLRAIFQVDPDAGSKMTGDVSNAYRAALKRFKASKGGKITDAEADRFKTRWQEKIQASRIKWEKRISSRIVEGRLRNFQNYTWHYAADLAWDGPAFKEQVPLMLYAQGRIGIQKAASQLEEVAGDRASDFIERDGEGREGIQAINITRLGESVINLVRPMVTRSVAALSGQFGSLYPFLSYESRSKTMPDKIRAAVTSQRIEMITDMQGYRHDFTQWCRQMLMHGGQWCFVSHPWMREKSIRKVGDTQESYTTKEGPKIVHPHPTRTFYDIAHAPATINSDNGVKYCGFWDILRYGDVLNNPNYFNTDNIRFTTDLDELTDSYSGFFEAYYGDGETMKFAPPRKDDLDARKNDRKSLSGILNGDNEDCSIYFSQYYERIIPKQVGLGHYPYPVWVKLTVANDKTVVRARILPSRPAFYMGHNEDDSRYVNTSMAHEIMPYQDQAQSLLSQMYYLMRLEQLVIASIDTDLVPDKKMREQIRDYLKGNRTRAEAFYLEWSGSQLRQQLKINPEPPVRFNTSSVQAQIATTITGIKQTMELVERNLMMSPAELGQMSRHESSATENLIVEKTTNALHSYKSQGPAEGRAAFKVILYESYMALGDDDIPTPVTTAFPRNAVIDAGFKFYGEEEGVEPPEEEREPEGRTVIASKVKMAHDFIFNSRDGEERTVSVEAAKTLQQFVYQILANKEIMRIFGWKQITGMLSEVFRLAGSPFTIQLPEELPEGGPGDASAEMQQFAEQFTQQFQQLSEALQEQVASVAESSQVNEENLKTLEQNTSDAFESIVDKINEKLDDHIQEHKS